MIELSQSNDLLTFFILLIGVLSSVIGIMRWKIHQITTGLLNETSQSKDIIDNHRDLNQLKEMVLKIQGNIEALRDRLSKMEGEWTQHNREKNNRDK